MINAQEKQIWEYYVPSTSDSFKTRFCEIISRKIYTSREKMKPFFAMRRSTPEIYVNLAVLYVIVVLLSLNSQLFLAVFCPFRVVFVEQNDFLRLQQLALTLKFIGWYLYAAFKIIVSVWLKIVVEHYKFFFF